MKTKKPPRKKPHPKKTPKPAIPTLQGFDIEEYSAIEAWKRGQPERLTAWVAKQPLSLLLRALVLDLLQGKKVRKQGASKDLKKKHRYHHALDLASIYDVHTKKVVDRVDGVPVKRPVGLVHEDAATLVGRSIGQIKKVYYDKPTRQQK